MLRAGEAHMAYLGIDWGIRRAAWCALDQGGELIEGMMSADEQGLARLVHRLGPDVRGCIEMMSGAVWVRDQLAACGWSLQIADARKVKAVAPLACKTDRVDARVLAELVRRDLVPAVWMPSVEERANRERLRRRMHFDPVVNVGDEPQFRPAHTVGAAAQRDGAAQPRTLEQLAAHGVPEVWRQSIVTLLGVIDDL